MSDKNQKSSVYLLVLKEKPLFKIGKADDTILRMSLLEKKWGRFDLDKSVEIVCLKDKVYKLENTLHYVFSDSSIKMKEKHEGHTEWFDISCFDAVVSMVENIKIQNSGVFEIKNGILFPKSIQKSHLSREEKRNNEIRKREERLSTITQENEENAQSMVESIESLRSQITYFNREVGLILFRSEEDIWNTIDKIFRKSLFLTVGGGINLSSSCGHKKGEKMYFVFLNSWTWFIKDKDIEVVPSIEILDKYFSTLEKDEAIDNDKIFGEELCERALT